MFPHAHRMGDMNTIWEALYLCHRVTSRDPELLAATVLKGLQREPHFLTQINCALGPL